MQCKVGIWVCVWCSQGQQLGARYSICCSGWFSLFHKIQHVFWALNHHSSTKGSVYYCSWTQVLTSCSESVLLKEIIVKLWQRHLTNSFSTDFSLNTLPAKLNPCFKYLMYLSFLWSLCCPCADNCLAPDPSFILSILLSTVTHLEPWGWTS